MRSFTVCWPSDQQHSGWREGRTTGIGGQGKGGSNKEKSGGRNIEGREVVNDWQDYSETKVIVPFNLSFKLKQKRKKKRENIPLID